MASLSEVKAVSFSRLPNGHVSAHYICGRRGFAARGPELDWSRAKRLAGL
jgi:hypothetical protein